MHFLHTIPLAALLLVGLAQAQTGPSAAKKELIDKIIKIQSQPLADGLANQVIQSPLPQLMQAGRSALQQVPAEKREAAAKAMEADLKKFVEENLAYVKDKTLKAMPSTTTALLDERFTEEELRQVLGWMESPVSKKFGQTSVELQKAVAEKVMSEAGPTLDGRFKTLQAAFAKHLGLPPPGQAPVAGSKPAAASAPAAKK